MSNPVADVSAPPSSLAARADALGRHGAAFLGFSIPISVALDNTLLVLILALWFAGGRLKEKAADIIANPVALAALALFGMLCVGLLYGNPAPGDGLRYLGKYDKLLFIPILLAYFRDAATRELALRWFCVAMVLTFIVAELIAFGLLADNPVLVRPSGYTGAFKASISHGLLSAVAAYLFALLALRESGWPRRLLFGVLALIAIKNVAFVAISRTGYLVLTLLALHFSFFAFRLRGLVIACLLLTVSAAAIYAGSASFRERVDTIVSDSGNWQGGRWPSRESVNQRLDWYKRSLEIVREHPLLGVGTGSFPRAMAGTATDAQSIYTQNPHNEYLMITVQTGVVGLVLLLHLFFRQLASARKLASPTETQLAYGLLIAMGIGCAFNSLLLDHTEGLFYVWLTAVLYGGWRANADSR